MPTERDIRRRMSSVNNIAKITKAMELIAVTRLRRAQQRVMAARPYAEKMRQVLAELERRVAPSQADEVHEQVVLHPLLERRPIERVALILLTTNRGLCGALNSNTIRAGLQFVYDRQNRGQQVDVIVVGRKGLQVLRRRPVRIVAEFTNLGDYPTIQSVSPIARVAMDAFTGRQVDEVIFVYPRFVSTMRQEPTAVPLLPIQSTGEEAVAPSGVNVDYIYEPSPQAVLAALLPRYVEVQVYHAVLELIASEFAAKMVAMRNATDNATELSSDLRLGLNKARQARITREIIEVSAGAGSEKR